MTSKEAIEILQNEIDSDIFVATEYRKKIHEALSLGIKALEERPQGDLISRKALRKAVNDFYDNHFKGLVPKELITYAEAVDNFIDNAPTVEEVSVIEFKEPLPLVKAQKIVKALSNRPQGEWIKNETRPNEYQCANCGNYDLSYFPFCHWCGADMRGKENEQ